MSSTPGYKIHLAICRPFLDKRPKYSAAAAVPSVITLIFILIPLALLNVNCALAAQPRDTSTKQRNNNNNLINTSRPRELFAFDPVDVDTKNQSYSTNTSVSSTTTTTTLPTSTSRPVSARLSSVDSSVFQSPWTWACNDGVSCTRQMAYNNISEERVSLEVCWLTCGQYGPLWPFPSVKSVLSKNLMPFYPQNVEVTNIYAPHLAVRTMLGFAGNSLLDSLFRMHPKSEGNSLFPTSSGGRKIEHNIVTISLTAQSADTRITLSTDETYTLTIAPYYEGQGHRLHIEINAVTYFGVRHGLETLSQLIAFDEVNECLRIVMQASIQDRPAFPYRGLMIDTSRNFIPIQNLKRMVHAMSQNKLNILHWHITDTNSFPFYSKSVPQMTKYGAYSSTQIYMPKDIKDLVLYAKLRGVKIIPELDAPAHAGNGWQWGPLEGLGDLALCVNSEPWRSFCGQPPCGQLNPLNRYTYIILGELYKDFLEVFDKDIFHMGGDEIFFQCWYNNIEVQNWQRNRSTFDLMDLWGFFQEAAFLKLKEANGRNPISPIVWTSDMTSRGRNFLSPSDYILQIWTSSTHYDVRDILKEKYRVIFSNVDSTYLDHGFGTWLGRDHMWQIKTWQDLYDNDLKRIAEFHMGIDGAKEVFRNGQILGAEATLWAEKVDEHNMEMKLWPRSSAFAERLWSHPPNRTESVYPRLLHHRERMVRRGVHADRMSAQFTPKFGGEILLGILPPGEANLNLVTRSPGFAMTRIVPFDIRYCNIILRQIKE